jgi:caffeoyl-CoA O-methyltransferase
MREPEVVVRSQFIDDDVAAYAARHSSAPDDVQRELRSVTRERTKGAAVMQVGDDQALLIEMIARGMCATRAVEIGTFTGLSAMAIARGMGPSGRLLCCDVSEEWTSVAREFWERAGVADRIELRLGPGLDTVGRLPADERFDLAFVDADKSGYPDYYEELVPRLRPGGILLVDNTLQGGRVLDPQANDEGVVAVRRLNDRVRGDPRVRVVLLPFGDGVSMIQKVPDQ